MPTYDARTGEPAGSAIVALPDGLRVTTIVVRNLEVSFFDEEGRESVLIQRPASMLPGAGLVVEFGDHVRVEDRKADET